MKSLYAIHALERGKSHGEAANLEPGDVFSAGETESNRLLSLSAAREATDEDVALAKVRNRCFVTESSEADEASVAKVEKAVTKAKGAKAADKPAAETPAATTPAADNGESALV